MKKFRNFVSCLPCIVGGVFCIVLLSCTNFLNGAEIKEQIEQEIAYANAPKYEIRCAVDSSEYGQIYPTSVTVIKGESFSIEFKKTPAVTFDAWVCVDPDTGEVLEDAVIFSDEMNVDSKYTVNAKLNCEKSNLIIKPFCYLEVEAVPLPPTIKTVRVARTREDALNGTNLIPLEEFSYYAKKSNFGGDADAVEANIDVHHVKDTVWFYIEANDDGSGVGSISVKETFFRRTDGTSLPLTSEYTTTYLNQNSNSVAGVFELKLKCPSDGVIKLSFIASDRGGESAVSNQSVDLIKDTKFEALIYFIKNTIDFPDYTTGMVDYNFIVMPYDNYSTFATDMDGVGHKEGFGDRWDSFGYYSQHEEYIGRLANFVRAESGYSEDSLSLVPSENITFCEDVQARYNDGTVLRSCAYRCRIRTDTGRDTFVRIVLSDMVGNEYSQIFTIPKSVSIVSCTEDSETLEDEDEDGNPFEFETPRYKFVLGSTPSNFRIFWVKRNADGTINPDIIRSEDDLYNFMDRSPGFSALRNGTYTFAKYDESFGRYIGELTMNFEDGMYNVYCVPYISGNRSHFTSCVGKPFVVYKGCEKPAVPAPSASDLPASFSVDIDPPVVNAEKRTVHIRYPEDFRPNPNLVYMVRYRHDANPSLDVYALYALDESTTLMDFEVPTTFYMPYYFSIVAYNSRGDKRETPYTVLKNETCYDNVRPSVYFEKYMTTPNAIILESDRVLDEGVGLFKNESGKNQVQYFYSSRMYNTDNLNENNENAVDWNSAAVRTVEYDSGDYCVFPFDGNMGKYLNVRVCDKNGNGVVDSVYTFSDLNRSTSINYTGGTFKVSCEWPSELYNSYWGNDTSYYTYTYLTAQYFDGSEWKLTNQMGASTKKSMAASSSARTFSYNPTFSTAEKSCFVRVQPWTSYGERIYDICYAPVYIYPKYYTENITCDLKNFMQGSMGLSVLADNPVLVHTFYSTVNLGNTVEDWLYGGIETGTVQKSKSFTYGNEYLAGVPKGKYYTTIIHFADGTMAMTGVNKK